MQTEGEGGTMQTKGEEGQCRQRGREGQCRQRGRVKNRQNLTDVFYGSPLLTLL